MLSVLICRICVKRLFTPPLGDITCFRSFRPPSDGRGPSLPALGPSLRWSPGSTPAGHQGPPSASCLALPPPAARALPPPARVLPPPVARALPPPTARALPRRLQELSPRALGPGLAGRGPCHRGPLSLAHAGRLALALPVIWSCPLRLPQNLLCYWRCY